VSGDSEALKARNVIAQGNALGNNRYKIFEVLKARYSSNEREWNMIPRFQR